MQGNGDGTLQASKLYGTTIVNVRDVITDSFMFSGPLATTAGVAQSDTLAVLDPSGAVDTGYNRTVVFSSSDAQAGLPATYTFTAADAGVRSFAVTLKTAGSESITATDTATATVTGTQPGIAITAGAVTRFGLSAPTSATAGVSFTVKVSALDAYGNVVAGYRGKVHFSDWATNAGLPSDYTFGSGDNGGHSFSITLNTVAIQTITLTDTVNATVKGSATVNVAAKTSGGGGTSGGGSGSGSGGSA